MVLKDYDFRKLLARVYQRVQASGEKPRLVIPTRKNIKLECLDCFDKGIEARDQKVLEVFFGKPRAGESMRDKIEGYPLDNFSGFMAYLKKPSIYTDNRNVNLLAWLLDFPHRPNRNDNVVLLSDEEREVLGLSGGGSIPEDSGTAGGHNGTTDPTTVNVPGRVELTEEPGANQKNEPADAGGGGNKWPPKWLKRVAAILSVGAVCTAGYVIVTPAKKCMYWTGDHYEKVRCGEEPNGRFIIQINPAELDMKRITREDSIREQHIDKLFYIKKNNDIQYFTKRGRYPEDLNRDLQELSRHIFDKDSSERRLNSNNKP